jgi:hypothetical protein
MKLLLLAGTDMECIYNLMTFGIPSDVLPILPSGEHRLEGHHELIRRLRKEEELDDHVDRVVLPGSFDVLLGRGKPLQKHAGNLRYHHIIENDHDRYERAMKLEKTHISKFIVEKINGSGGRFLKQDEAGWVEIDDAAARYKVSHTFRNHRIAARTAQKKALAAAVPPLAPSAGKGRRVVYDSDSTSETGHTMATTFSVDQKRRRLSDVASSVQTV